MGGSLQSQPGSVAEQVVSAGCASAWAGAWWGRDGCERVAGLPQLLSFEQFESQLVLLSLVVEAVVEAVVVVGAVVGAVVEAEVELESEFEVLAEAV